LEDDPQETFKMDDMPLQNPVAIAVGAGSRRDITTLAEMQNFLQEWPHARRGKIYETALRACEMARAGHVTKDQALRAFTVFTETAGIAWTGIDPVTALRLAKAAQPRSTL
jgi:hypothetical protein